MLPLEIQNNIEQMNQKIVEIKEEYAHILSNFVPRGIDNLPKIGQSLGYNAFLSDDCFLYLIYGKYQSRKFDYVCAMCSQINVEGLMLNHNNHQSMIKQISVCLFPRLRLLDLSNNKIESIQMLSQVYMPDLNFINLSKNLISCLRPLSRIIFNKITFIDLNCNKYVELPQILPETDIELDSRVVDKTKIFKALISTKLVQKRGGKLLSSYFV